MGLLAQEDYMCNDWKSTTMTMEMEFLVHSKLSGIKWKWGGGEVLLYL
jgi:hypothetical protein